MLADKKGFIVNYYTTANGIKLTREQLAERILALLNKGALNCGNIARTLKLTKQSIYNVAAYMIQKKMITKYKGDSGVYMYRKLKECLLADLLYPSPEEVEKKFKIKSRQRYRPEDGTSKGFGKGGINPYTDHYLNSVLWEGVD